MHVKGRVGHGNLVDWLFWVIIYRGVHNYIGSSAYHSTHNSLNDILVLWMSHSPLSVEKSPLTLKASLHLHQLGEEGIK